MLVESLALALMGGFVGIGFAVVVVKLVLKLSPTRLPRFQIAIDETAVLFTLAV
jgi:ABC-type antimicrobial peptide transport system permease subunit